MRVLISGASGFVGSEVLKYLLEHTDWEFTCVCSWVHKGSPFRIDPTNPRVKVITHDLIAPLPEIGNFDYILNIASESHVDRSIKDPYNFIMNNTALTLNMLEYARSHRPDIFIQFSTDEVYGATNHGDWDVFLPSNPYASSKAGQEMNCIAYYKTYSLPIVITNSNNIIGIGQDPEKFVPKITKLIREDKVVDIHTTNGIPGKRYYNPVGNVAEAIRFILSQLPATYPYEDRPDRYSIPGGVGLDNLEMAKLVAKVMGKELKYELVDAETVRPGYDQFYAETEGEKLLSLGFKPPFELVDEIERIVEQS